MIVYVHNIIGRIPMYSLDLASIYGDECILRIFRESSNTPSVVDRWLKSAQ